MTYFFALRSTPPMQGGPQTQPGARVGLTAGKVLGNAVQRNRIKRRMREAVRTHHGELMASVDVILHPRRSVLEAEFAQIERDVQRAFRAVQSAMQSAVVAAKTPVAGKTAVATQSVSLVRAENADTAQPQ